MESSGSARINTRAADALPVGSTIGILGGGQLARMLAAAAARLGYQTIVLDPADPCPAAQTATAQIVATYDDETALELLAARCDVVTYEFENVPDRAAAFLAERTTLHPNADALAISQDRLIEKRFMSSIGLSTAPFQPVDSQAELESAVADLGGSVILKSRRLGYDGKGQLRIDGQTHSNSIQPDAFDQLGGVPLIAEGFVDFVAEISVIAARSTTGDIRTFEPARNEHRDGILATSTVPSGQSPTIIERAKSIAAALIEALDYVGVLGLELFVLSDDTLVVNEFAPRVHNSGHWTELACVTDQFEQHIRAITGNPLGSTQGASCEMVNLIGHDVERVPELLEAGVWRVHLYGKSEVRPGRKMGHATRLV